MVASEGLYVRQWQPAKRPIVKFFGRLKKQLHCVRNRGIVECKAGDSMWHFKREKGSWKWKPVTGRRQALYASSPRVRLHFSLRS